MVTLFAFNPQTIGKIEGENEMTDERVSQDQLFKNVVASLRRVASEIEDSRLGMRLAAAIASVTKSRIDVNLAVDRAKGHGSISLRAEALAVVVKTLAEGRHFTGARLIASEMTRLDAYWRAEAYIWIARFSGEDADIKAAEVVVSHINTPYLRNELRTDMKSLLHHKHHHTEAKNDRHLSDFKALQAILAELKGLEDSHVVTPKFNSAHLRLIAQEIIDRIFAAAMK